MARTKRCTLLIAAALLSAGCQRTHQWVLPATPLPDTTKSKIVGVTTKALTAVKFDEAAKIEGTYVVARVNRKTERIPLTDVLRFWVETREFSGKRTVALVAVAGAVAATAAIIATRDHQPEPPKPPPLWRGFCCLYVYSWNGSEYTFDTETATGAITRGLERDDYALLKNLREQDGEYRLLLSNDNDETQYTDLAELWIVDHEPGVIPRAGSDGRLYAIGQPLPPIERLTFPKPPGAIEAKLVVSATLTPLAGEVGARLLGVLGRDLPLWYERIDSDLTARAELTEWMAREGMFALKIEVEEPEGWHVRGMMPTAGPFVSDERVVPLDVSRVIGDQLRIRLQPAPGFWALKSFAVDYGENRPLRVTRIPVKDARDWSGRDVSGALRAADGEYLEMSEMGQRALVTFAAPPRIAGLERTVFLHSRGYYRMHLSSDTAPDWETYRHILNTPGAASIWAGEIAGAGKR